MREKHLCLWLSMCCVPVRPFPTARRTSSTYTSSKGAGWHHHHYSTATMMMSLVIVGPYTLNAGSARWQWNLQTSLDSLLGSNLVCCFYFKFIWQMIQQMQLSASAIVSTVWYGTVMRSFFNLHFTPTITKLQHLCKPKHFRLVTPDPLPSWMGSGHETILTWGRCGYPHTCLSPRHVIVKPDEPIISSNSAWNCNNWPMSS